MQRQAAALAQEQGDLSAMLNLIVMSAVEILRGSAGVIALWDEDEQRFVSGAHYGLDEEELKSLHPRLDRAILSILGQEGEMVSTFHLPGKGRRATPRQRMEHILALPLKVEGRLIGVIYVFRRARAARFRVKDVHLLEVFARQAALAIEQTRLMAELLEEKERLEEMKSGFLSIVSHELQTPVTIIKGYAGTLTRQDAPWSPETVRRVAAYIEEESDRLTRLITDLLDLSRVQAGRVALHMGPVQLAELAAEVAEAMRPRSDKHQIKVSFPPDFPEVEGDHEALRRCLSNLVDNAIKYSPNGGEVSIRGQVRDGEVLLAVEDQGIGVPPEERERIFERFHRGSPVRGDSKTPGRYVYSFPGTGLGLYICKTITDAHGGRIWVESPGAGMGSTFYVALPVGQPSREPAPVREIPRQRATGEILRRALRRRMLPQPGLTPESAGEGPQAGQTDGTPVATNTQ